MPDINSPIRSQTSALRAAALVDSAESEITNCWSGRSWSEVLGNAWGNRNWVAGQGLKVAINMTVGTWVSPLANSGLSKIGTQYTQEALTQGWALVEDVIKGKAEEFARATPTVVTGAIQTIQLKIRGTAAPVADLDIVECVTGLQAKVVELGQRVKNVQAAATNGRFRYCDDVHWAVRELAHAEACRLTVINDCNQAIAVLQAFKQTAEQALPNATTLKDEFKRAAERVVADEVTVKHKNHENFGVLGSLFNPYTAISTATTSCSKEHCFGKSP